MLKVNLEVIKEVKVDGRSNNTGRPVNKKSARQARLEKQAYLSKLNKLFKEGNQFSYKNGTYKYSVDKDNGGLGCILNNVSGYVCNVEYIGRTKVKGFTFVMGKRVNIELNLKTLQFVSE
tara:strand:- start:157 stop:516 length:360 start_codon:yes stop_codon:yes gene_type:complete